MKIDENPRSAAVMKRIAIEKGPIGRESLKAGGPFPIDVSGGDSYGFMRLMERLDIYGFKKRICLTGISRQIVVHAKTAITIGTNVQSAKWPQPIFQWAESAVRSASKSRVTGRFLTNNRIMVPSVSSAKNISDVGSPTRGNNM
jgi:hypothetical protein